MNIFMGNGDGTFQAYTEVSNSPFYADWVVTGDFNGDGTTDLAFGSKSLGVWNSSPFVGIHPSVLNFGGVPVDSTSAVQTINVWNVRNSPLQIKSLTTGGDFSQSNDCGDRVPIGGQCSVNVTFTPTGGGSRNAILALTGNAPVHKLTVPLLGTGTGLSVTASPASLALGSVMVGATTNSQTVTFSNTGSVSLLLSAVTVTNPFAVVASGTTCPTSGMVAAGSNCTVAVNFTPTATGPATGSLSFSDDASGSPQSVSLSGTGLGFTLAAASGSTTTANVKAGQTATYNLSLAPTPGFNSAINLTRSSCSRTRTRAWRSGWFATQPAS